MTIEAKLHHQLGDFLLDTDFSLPLQGVNGIFGPSGCGKTTVLRILAGLEPSNSSRLRVGNEHWQSENVFVPAEKRSVAYVFQESNLFPHLSVEENLRYGWKRCPDEQRAVSFTEIVELLQLAQLTKRYPDELSGGQRQRVAIGRALLTSPKLVLMDEPLASLDDQSKAEIIPFLDRLFHELSLPVLYVSHSASELAQMSTHLLLMENGRITTSGAPTDLFSRLDLPLVERDEAASLIEAKVVRHEPEEGLSYFSFADGIFAVSLQDLALGSLVRLQVQARDVSLTLSHHNDSSIVNIFSGSIDELQVQSSGQVLIRVLVGKTPFLARITAQSAKRLELRNGRKVFVQVKGVALLPGR